MQRCTGKLRLPAGCTCGRERGSTPVAGTRLGVVSEAPVASGGESGSLPERTRPGQGRPAMVKLVLKTTPSVVIISVAENTGPGTLRRFTLVLIRGQFFGGDFCIPYQVNRPKIVFKPSQQKRKTFPTEIS